MESDEKACRRLFQQLGALRDAQVMMEWVERLASPNEETSRLLNKYLSDQAIKLKDSASEALEDFDRKKWTSWIRLLPSRTRRIPLEGMAFRHLALERWAEARELHRQALRNRSHVAYHRLRIGLKKFRYIAENFLPERHSLWGAELRALQDILGEMNDLHVLWRTALSIRAFSSEEIRAEWRLRISEERNRRLKEYRRAMLGKESLWKTWQADLSFSDRMDVAALARLRAWASFRDPGFSHAEHVADLSLQIFDGLNSLGLIQKSKLPDARFLLEAAALAHDVGMTKAGKKHQVVSYRMIRKLNPSPGWDASSLNYVALIARFHRGSLPHLEQKAFAGIPPGKFKTVILLCGILRLANAFDSLRQKRIRRLTLRRTAEMICISAPGYSENDAAAIKLAAARHLLEAVCGMPIMIGQS